MPRRPQLPLAIGLLLVAAPAAAQTCFFGAGFDDGALPPGWTSSTATVQATGEQTAAWRVGTSADADANGFFPVPDIPIGNRFAMADDDAPPCDCDLQAAILTTAPISLSGRAQVALECRVFHDGTLGGGPALIEASADGSTWVRIDSVPAAAGQWQERFADLAAFDGAPAFQLRFTWSDNGGWASGFAVDDLCLYERHAHDLAITRAFLNDPSASPFDPSVRSLAYTMLPLEQAAGLHAAVEVENRGTAALSGITVAGSVTLGGVPLGSAQGASWPELAPGERILLPVGPIPDPGSTGLLAIHLSAAHDGPPDGDPASDTATVTVRITGPGWTDGYGAMALDAGQARGVQRSESNFIAAVRMELAGEGSAARGISAVLDPASQAGELVRGILMDGHFTLIDTTLRHALTEADLQAAATGEPLYLPFPVPPELPAADCFAGLQRLSGSGSVGVLTSGNGPIGAAAFMQGLSFDITWLTAMPMVRLHLSDFGVGLAATPEEAPGLRVRPVPVHDEAWVEHRFSGEGPSTLLLADASGRVVRRQELGVMRGEAAVRLDASGLAPGLYVLRILEADRAVAAMVAVAR